MNRTRQSQPDNDWDELGIEINTPMSEINEHKRIEEELGEAKESFDQFAPSLEGIVIYEKVKILEANQTLAAMFGYKLSLGGFKENYFSLLYLFIKFKKKKRPRQS